MTQLRVPNMQIAFYPVHNLLYIAQPGRFFSEIVDSCNKPEPLHQIRVSVESSLKHIPF